MNSIDKVLEKFTERLEFHNSITNNIYSSFLIINLLFILSFLIHAFLVFSHIGFEYLTIKRLVISGICGLIGLINLLSLNEYSNLGLELYHRILESIFNKKKETCTNNIYNFFNDLDNQFFFISSLAGRYYQNKKEIETLNSLISMLENKDYEELLILYKKERLNLSKSLANSLVVQTTKKTSYKI